MKYARPPCAYEGRAVRSQIYDLSDVQKGRTGLSFFGGTWHGMSILAAQSCLHIGTIARCMLVLCFGHASDWMDTLLQGEWKEVLEASEQLG